MSYRHHPLRFLRQSGAEREARNDALAGALGGLVRKHVRPATGRALDVGCQTGLVTDLLARDTGYLWCGVDPVVASRELSARGQELLHGWAHDLPFPDGHFDCVSLVSVYEHIEPSRRAASLAEIRRVLVDGGIVVGQLPNPHFPIEPHSRLPLMGWLPLRIQRAYWRLSPATWDHSFYVVTMRSLRRAAESVGFETVVASRFNYSGAAIPRSVRWAASALQVPMRLVPWSWQFVFRKG